MVLSVGQWEGRMAPERLTLGVLTVGCVAFVAGAAAGVASAQSRPLILAGAAARESAAHVGNLVLVGVIIAGDRSLAVFTDSSAGPGASEMVRVGGSLSGHRLIDIQVDRVTVETPGGERVTVRLAAGSGGIPTRPGASETAIATDAPTGPARSRRSERRRERARLAAERAASGQATNAPTEVTE